MYLCLYLLIESTCCVTLAKRGLRRRLRADLRWRVLGPFVPVCSGGAQAMAIRFRCKHHDMAAAQDLVTRLLSPEPALRGYATELIKGTKELCVSMCFNSVFPMCFHVFHMCFLFFAVCNWNIWRCVYINSSLARCAFCFCLHRWPMVLHGWEPVSRSPRYVLCYILLYTLWWIRIATLEVLEGSLRFCKLLGGCFTFPRALRLESHARALPRHLWRSLAKLHKVIGR